MTLAEYIAVSSIEALADAVGVDAATICRYRNGTRFPRREIMLRIVAATGGKVTIESFYAPNVDAAKHRRSRAPTKRLSRRAA